MKRHASMNRIYRVIWSQVRGAWIAVAETVRGRGKSSSRKLVAATLLLSAGVAQADPTGGQVAGGSGSIAKSGATTTITQSSQNLSLTWKSFNIGAQETVNFLQPSVSAIAVNRIFDTGGTQILGHLNANGQVWLINPNGILFGQGAQVNVGGLVASTLDLNEATFGANARSFSGSGTGSVVNRGTISAAQGGYVALLGKEVSNQGTILARLGTVALGAGSAATLTFNGNSLVKMQVDQSLLNSVAENGGLIRADGGTVLLSAGAKNALLASVVNNSGVIEARTVENREGVIVLLGGMSAGTVKVGGTLDASAPNGGNGGFIETSAAHVKVANDAKVTTAAALGLAGTWLIDPTDFTIAASGGDMTGASLSGSLVGNNVTILSTNGAAGTAGEVNVNDVVAWSAHKLTLNAKHNININANLNGSGSASLALQYGQGALAAGNTSNYILGSGAHVNLPAGLHFSTKLGSNGATTNYTVITSLGTAGSTTGTDLQGMNGGLAGKYALGSDIDAAATNSWNAGAGFDPVGNLSTQFTGAFDGLGHSISNLTINRPSTNYVGLFGVSNGGAAIRNVGLVGGSVLGYTYVGSLVGTNYGTVSNSYATGSVNSKINFVGGLVGYNSGTVSNSYATGGVGGTYGAVGGLAGRNDGTISKSHATGSASGTYGDVGGLAGRNYGSIVDSYATASVSGAYGATGGLAGVNLGTVSNSYATGGVSGTLNFVGGLVGYNLGTVSNSYATGGATGAAYVGGLVGYNGSTVSNTYATGSVSGNNYVGGLVGYNYGAIATSYWNSSVHATGIGGGTTSGALGRTSTQMQNWFSFTGFNFTTVPGAAGNNWVIVNGNGSLNNNGVGSGGGTMPMLASEYSTIIRNTHELQLMAMAPGASYTLAQNIDASASGAGTDVWGNAGFVPIGRGAANFTGTFDGLNHTISGLVINRPGLNSNNVGLFAVTSVTAAIRNVGLLGGSVTGNNYVGGLVGKNAGTVSNSYTTGVVIGINDSGGLVGRNTGTIVSSHATGLVGGINAGGLVGRNTGTVTDSYATGNVGGTSDVGGLVGLNNYGTVSNSYSTGNVLGGPNVGGLVGRNYGGTISDSYATGAVGNGGGIRQGGLVGRNDYGTISNSYATGNVLAASIVGGLVGANYGGAVSASHATGNVGGATYVGGLIGVNHDGAVSDSYATGGVSNFNNATQFFGGLVGYNTGTVGNSYATGNLNSTADFSRSVGGLVGFNVGTVSNSHATGSVSTGGSFSYGNVGGLVGHNYGTVGGSYATGSVTAATSAPGVGGLVGSNGSTGAINSSYATGSVSSGLKAGGLVGINNGTVSDSYATGSANGNNSIGGLVGYNVGTVSDSYATGSVGATIQGAGGLVGSNTGTVSNSYATGSVIGSGSNNVGGLVGSSTGTVSNSYATGSANGYNDVGGLVGRNYGTVSSSHATGGVNGNDVTGGLVGRNYGTGTISNSYATGSVNGGTHTGGLVGRNYGSIGNSYATGGVSGNNAVGGLVGSNYGTGTVSNSYATGSVSGNYGVGGLVGYNYGSISNSYATGSVSGSIYVGGLVGNNYGTGTISNSYATGSVSGSNSDVGGLVGFNDATGTISNSHATGQAGALYNSGGLVGRNDGTVSNSYATGGASGDNEVGGLVGYNNGTIGNSYATGSVSGSASSIGGLVGANGGTVNNSYATGSVSGYINVGGLVGFNYGTGTISNSYATGSVSGNSYVGGLVGINNGMISNSFWNTETSGQSSSAGGLGLTTAQMQTQANFTSATPANGNVNPGWDFASTWVMYEGYTYPLLRSFMTPLTVSASNIAKTYDGLSAGVSGVTYSSTPNANLLGTLGYGGAKDAGSHAMGGLYSNQQGYIIGYMRGTLTINRALLTVTGTVASDKVYNATTSAVLTSGSLDGVIPGDTVTLTQRGTFASKNVGTGIAVTAADRLGGASAGNYTLTQPTGLTADITPRNLAVTGLTASGRVYDATTVETLGGTAAIVALGTDDVALGGTPVGAFASKNVGTNKMVIVSGNTISGADAGNYNLLQQTGLRASVTPASLTVSGITTASDKVYNATTSAILTGGSLNGVFSGDTVTLIQAGIFASKNVGTGIAVTAADRLGGASAGNYTLLQPTGSLSANITARNLAVTGLTAFDKAYDGTTAATLGGTAAISALAGDDVTLGGTAVGAFANKNVGTNKSVIVTGNTISGADAGNYNLLQQGGLRANITP